MDYIFKPTSTNEDSLKAILDLLILVYHKADKFTYDFIKWQYKDNPNGEVVGYDAYAKDVLAAHYATIPIVMNLFGQERKGLLSINTATHPDHRGKRLFSILAEKTIELAKELGYDFIIGAANANSTHGFLKYLGFYLISPLDVKVGVGNYKMRSELKCKAIWSTDAYKWRSSNPAYSYYTNGTLLFANKSVGVKAAIKRLSKVEVENTTRKCIDISHPVNLYVGLGRVGGLYVNVPKFIERSPFNLIFRDLSGDIPTIKKENIAFELFDYDVI